MTDQPGIVATYYRIDPSQPGLTLQGGLRSHAVTDRRDPSQKLIAIEAKPGLPFRPKLTLARAGLAVPCAVLPVDYGAGRDLAGQHGCYVVGERPPGTALGIGTPWRENDLISYVLVPAASALAGLQARGLTHRAINPDNLFRSGPREPVTLGPFWAAPPASLQPAIFEPPYMACCLPTGRGEGAIADDVYALGVTLLCLATGRVPLAGLDDAAILRRKLELGSFAALTGEAALPPLISDLLRGMLAEDPDHRPPPTMLLRPEQARARRVAARPPRRAQLPLDVAGTKAWTARDLALSLTLQPERGYVLLKSGEVERWLRRCLGDPQIAMRVEEVVRRPDPGAPDDLRQQSLTVLRSVAALDPLTPLAWRGVALQPDGLGTALAGAALAGAAPEVLATLESLVLADAVPQFLSANFRRADHATLRDAQREWRAWLTARGPAGGVKRLTYGLNPMLACASPLLAGRPVVRAAELLPALDDAAAHADRSRPPIDAHVAAFLVARTDPALAGDLPSLASFAGPAERLSLLRLFARLQSRLHQAPLPGLAGWLVACGVAGTVDWRSHRTRAALRDRLLEAASDGQIGAMAELLDNEGAREADRRGAEQAAARIRCLKDVLKGIETDTPKRADAAQMLAHEVVTACGLIASLGAAMAVALQ